MMLTNTYLSTLIQFAANCTTVLTACLGIVLFFIKRKNIKDWFSVLRQKHLETQIIEISEGIAILTVLDDDEKKFKKQLNAILGIIDGNKELMTYPEILKIKKELEKDIKQKLEGEDMIYLCTFLKANLNCVKEYNSENMLRSRNG